MGGAEIVALPSKHRTIGLRRLPADDHDTVEDSHPMGLSDESLTSDSLDGAVDVAGSNGAGFKQVAAYNYGKPTDRNPGGDLGDSQ